MDDELVKRLREYAAARKGEIAELTEEAADAIEELKQENERLTAADVRPVVRGRWITRPYMLGNTQYCSLCGENYGMKYNFCPNCGADMRQT